MSISEKIKTVDNKIEWKKIDLNRQAARFQPYSQEILKWFFYWQRWFTRKILNGKS